MVHVGTIFKNSIDTDPKLVYNVKLKIENLRWLWLKFLLTIKKEKHFNRFPTN